MRSGKGDTPPGKVILLNGSSSAGKTTLAMALQRHLNEPYQHIALDQFRDGMPSRHRGLNSPDGTPGARGLNIVPTELDDDVVTNIRFGDIGERVLRGMRRAIAAFAHAGNNVIVDDLLLEQSYLEDYLIALNGLPVTLVGVRCDLPTVNAREAERVGRFPGTATSHFDTIHSHCKYDVEVDTASLTPRQCAERIAASMEQSSAFQQLRRELLTEA